jgi:hypothetical protein
VLEFFFVFENHYFCGLVQHIKNSIIVQALWAVKFKALFVYDVGQMFGGFGSG